MHKNSRRKPGGISISRGWVTCSGKQVTKGKMSSECVDIKWPYNARRMKIKLWYVYRRSFLGEKTGYTHMC